MARPTGRYFASVIAKIRDAKKKEQIVVDEGFRMQLRQQLMMKIAAQSAPAHTSWFERLAPFKSYLAVVPALGLVIVAVVGISKLPIDFNSKVVVPTSAPSQQSDEVQSLAMNTSSADTNAVTNGGIKTFPGRLALPSGYGRSGHEDQALPIQSLEANTAGPESVQAPQPLAADHQDTSAASTAPAPEQQQSVSPVPAPTVEQKQPVQYFSYQTSTNASRIGEGNVQTSSPAVDQNATAAPTVPSVSGSTPSVGTSPDSNASSVSGAVPLSATGSAPSVSTDAAAKTVVQPIVQPTSNTVAPTYSLKSTDIQKAKNISLISPSLTLNDIAALPAQHLSLNVLYNGNFSSDERTILEKNLLPNLVVEGKEVDYVRINQADAATVVIEVHYTGGTTVVFDYKVGDNGTLQLVESTLQRAAQ